MLVIFAWKGGVPTMPWVPGQKVGPYEVIAPLGAGGMGEVYRARDTRLSRDVAIKVLPTSFAADAERLGRFEREARAAGLLNHPNILQIHDTGSYEGSPYVVSELLEGETLRDRIGGTPMPPRKAIDYATQIAKGLAAAHDKGIVHRDLKPENLFLTRDGRVKILDFGLAKLIDGELLAEAETRTHVMPGTDVGRVLGTVGYMSPEQVRAQEVDHRSDIFAFGSVLYEMLSGKRAFRAPSAVETMNAILKEDPPGLSETNRNLPPGLERIVGHCLEKNPEERFQSVRDIAFDLEQLSGSAAQPALVAPFSKPRRSWMRFTAAGLVFVAVATGAFFAGRRNVKPMAPEFRPITFQTGNIGAARFAPDGRNVLYSATWQATTGRDLYIAQPGNPESRSLGLAGAILLAVSNTGELAVRMQRNAGPGGTLARMPMGGGAPRDVVEHVEGADWAPDGNSLAVIRNEAGRYRLEYPVGKMLYEATYLGNVRVSPRGDLVAFSNHPLLGDNRGDVEIIDRSGKRRTLSTNWADIRGLAWSPDGSEVWFTGTREGVELSLWGVSMNGKERQVYRAPGSMQIQDSRPDGRILLLVGRTKPALLGLAPGESRERNLSWLDYGWVGDISRDGKTLLFGEQGNGGGPDYAVYLRGTDASAPILLGKGLAYSLSPDGRSALVLDLRAPAHLALLPTGAGEARPLPRGPVAHFRWAAFFADGKRVAFTGNEPDKGPRLWVQEIAGGEPVPISPEGIGFTEGNPVSPDGMWVGGESDAGIALYPVAGGEPRRVAGSVEGDLVERFSSDGRSLYVREELGGNRLPVRVFRIDLATGARELWRELASTGTSGVNGIGSLTIAPDAASYVYTYFERQTTLYEGSGLLR
jgi:dipeptidyl aminopeptidase/acylaminoacyl peptidase